MTTEKVDQLFGYVQERCLWQFFSRTWDRKENLDGIMKTATDLLTGVAPKRETPMDKLFYADAKIMVADFKERFPWIKDTAPAEIATTHARPQGPGRGNQHYQVAEPRTEPLTLLTLNGHGPA